MRQGINQLLQTLDSEPTVAEVWAQVVGIDQKLTKTGKPFLDLQCSDGGEPIKLKIWDNLPWFADCSRLAPKDTICLKAQWSKGSFGVEAQSLEIRPLSADEAELLMAGSPELLEVQEAHWLYVCDQLGKLSDPRLRELCLLFLKKHELRLRRAAAARNYHHARRGGLVEHIGGMIRLADAVAHAYPSLNRDLLLTGCLFHDCGKLWENNYGETDFIMPYSETGEMLGHINLGIELVNTLWREMMQRPEAASWKSLTPINNQVRMHLLHLIAAHHGAIEWGSPVPPKTPEATMLHYIDNMDAKMEMFTQGYATSELLAPNVYQRKMPLPANMITPLPAFLPEEVGRSAAITPVLEEPQAIVPLAAQQADESQPQSDLPGMMPLL